MRELDVRPKYTFYYSSRAVVIKSFGANVPGRVARAYICSDADVHISEGSMSVKLEYAPSATEWQIISTVGYRTYREHSLIIISHRVTTDRSSLEQCSWSNSVGCADPA